MKAVPIRHVVDARASQGRVIIHLGCGHNAWIQTEHLTPEDEAELGLTGDPRVPSWPCKRCE